MKKRLLALLLALLTLLACLTACTADDVDQFLGDYGDEIIDDVIDGLEGGSAAPAGTEAPAITEAPEQTEDPAAPTEAPGDKNLPVYGEYYYDVVNVVLYLETYGELPPNYITKDEARDLGWSGGTVERYKEGAAIGGDRFGNHEGLLPAAQGRKYTECDIDTDGYGSRGARRLIFSNDGLYFYTDDHYESFKQVTVEGGKVTW